MKFGLTSPNINDISIDTHNEMTENWAAVAGFASILISNIFKEEDENTETFSIMSKWLEKLVVVVLAGFCDSLQFLNTPSDAESAQRADQTCSVCLIVFNNVTLLKRANSNFLATGTQSHCSVIDIFFNLCNF